MKRPFHPVLVDAGAGCFSGLPGGAAALREDLVKATEQGYSVTRGENVADVMAIVAPVRFGGTTLAVAIAGPMTRMEPMEQRLAKRLL